MTAVNINHQHVTTLLGDSIDINNPPPLTDEMLTCLQKCLKDIMPWSNETTKELCQNMKCYGFITTENIVYDRDLYMAWNIQYSGIGHNIVGLGITVISNADVIGQVLFPAFINGMDFNESTWKNYWCYQDLNPYTHEPRFVHLENLAQLQIDGDYENILKNITMGFFIIKGYFEYLAYKSNKVLHKTTNDNVFIAGILNELNKKYLPKDVHPNVAYTSIKMIQEDYYYFINRNGSQVYSGLEDVYSLLSGVLSIQTGKRISEDTGEMVQKKYKHIIKYPQHYVRLPHNESHITAIDLENYYRIIDKIAELHWSSWSESISVQFNIKPKINYDFKKFLHMDQTQ